jgi:hypothetical protein
MLSSGCPCHCQLVHQTHQFLHSQRVRNIQLLRSFDPPSGAKTFDDPSAPPTTLVHHSVDYFHPISKVSKNVHRHRRQSAVISLFDVIFTKRTIGGKTPLTDRVSACLVCCILLLFTAPPLSSSSRKRENVRPAFPRQNVTGSQLLRQPRDETLTSPGPCLFYDFMDCADVLQTVNRQKIPSPGEDGYPRTKVPSTALFQRVQSSNLP